MFTNQPDEFNETLNRYYIFQDIRNWDLYQITDLWLGYSDTMFWDIAENIMTRTAFSTIIKFKRLEEIIPEKKRRMVQIRSAEPANFLRRVPCFAESSR